MHYPPLPSAPSASPIYAYPRKCPLPISLPYRCTLLLQLHFSHPPFAISHLHFPPSFPTSFSHPSRCCHDQGKTKILQDQGKVSEYPKKSWKFFDIAKVSEKAGNLLALRPAKSPAKSSKRLKMKRKISVACKES